MASQWLPLESNPDVMGEYVHALGVPRSWCWSDVYGFDAELLAMVPQPVKAVVLLFPISEASERRKQEQEAHVAAPVSERVYFMTQTVGNACGTVGILHALCNQADELQLEPGSWLHTWVHKTSALDPQARGSALGEDTTLAEAHAAGATGGQSAVPDSDEEVSLHFVCFVHVEGGLYELDGRRPCPHRHGETTAADLLTDAARVIQREYVEASDGAVSFNVMALCAPAPEATA
jgi:ubiquitin carboxyl-terminal hydrolase L3